MPDAPAGAGELPVGRAIIDGGITPYQLPFPVRRLLLARDCIGFRLVTRSRGMLEAAFPPERFTLPGHDPKAEYDALQAYLRTYSRRTVRNVFWSGNNYALPRTPAETGTKITYWYGDDEKKRPPRQPSGSSSAIFRTSACAASRRWPTRSW